MASAAFNPCIYVFIRLKAAEGLNEGRQIYSAQPNNQSSARKKHPHWHRVGAMYDTLRSISPLSFYHIKMVIGEYDVLLEMESGEAVGNSPGMLFQGTRTTRSQGTYIRSWILYSFNIFSLDIKILNAHL